MSVLKKRTKQERKTPPVAQTPQNWWWKPGTPQGQQPGIVGIARQAAAESITMLSNKNAALPLAAGTRISIFGRIQIDYFFVGYGSGGDIRAPFRTGLLEALRRHPGISVNDDLSRIYENWVADNPAVHGGWGSWPTNHPEMPLDAETVQAAASATDVAVVVIGRSAGEDRETTLTEGSWYLTKDEKNMLELVTKNFSKVVVLINSGNIIDMSWVDNYKIDSLLYVWQGGMCAGSAIADIITGDQSPSGRLHASIANVYEDFPGAEQFGKVNNSVYVNYVEDIFVGYRYFETFAPQKVKYPFGYGIGYTNFDITVTDTKTIGGKITLTVKVTNTGKTYSGKEVVQVYHGAPQGKLDQPAKRLVAYAKTNLLPPGSSETLTIAFEIAQMAAYDDTGATGYRSAWVLEAGGYPIYVGKNVADVQAVYTYRQAATQVTEQLEEALAIWPKESAFSRYSIGKDGKLDTTTDITPTRTIDLAAEIKKEIAENTPNLPYRETPLDGEKAPIQLIDVCLGKATLEDFMAQMTVDELADLTRGGGPMNHHAGNPGNASTFAGHNDRLRKFFGIPAVSTNDGPSGIRMSGFATLCPIGTALANTWNDPLVEKLYAGVGREMLRNGVDALLAPGLNLQRNPLNGRNFEYFSEDPLLNGNMAASVCRGIQSEGVSPTPKHFVANNQETNRARGDSRVSERALRELYLRGFENLVKTAGVTSIMSSYNRVNGVWAPFSYQLQHRILRQQWGFDGIVMTDWWLKADDEHTNAFYDPDFDPGHGEARLGGNAYRVRGRVDLLKPGDQWHGVLPPGHQAEKGVNWTETNPATAVRAGLLEIGEVQAAVKNVLNFAMKSGRFRIDHGLELHTYENMTTMFDVEKPCQTTPTVDTICLDGTPLANFDAATTEYILFARELDKFPIVTATGTHEIEIVQASANAPAATIYVKAADGGQAIYRIFWDNRPGIDSHEANPVFARPISIAVNGKDIADFHWRIPSYTVVAAQTSRAEITAKMPKGVNYRISNYGDVYIFRAESNHQAMEYRIKIVTDPTAEKAVPVVELPAARRIMAGADRFYSSHKGRIAQATQPTGDPLTPGGEHVAWLDAGRYLLYNINVAEAGEYKVRARYASGSGGAAQLQLNLLLDTADDPATRFVLTPSGGWGEKGGNPDHWIWSDWQPLKLETGLQKLTVMSGGGFNLNFLEIEKA